MSKVTSWFEGGDILKTDCGHLFETDVQVDTGDEVVCSTCASESALRDEIAALKSKLQISEGRIGGVKDWIGRFFGNQMPKSLNELLEKKR